MSSLIGAFLTMSSGDAAVCHCVCPFFHRHRRHRSHRLNPFDFDLRELLDKSEHGVELALEMLDLVLGYRYAGEVRDAADGIGVDGHEISGAFLLTSVSL